MKVLHLPTSVGGQAWGLSQAERKLGIDSEVLYKSSNWLDYKSDIVLKDYKVKLLNILQYAKKAWDIHDKYDIFHFNQGCTLLDFPGFGLNHLDLPLYKDKKLFVTYNGCDARQKYKRMDQTAISACNYEDCYNGVCNNRKVEIRRKERITQFEEKGVNFFALNPDLMNFLPNNTMFIPYTIAAWDLIEKADYKYDGKVLNIVHAPTNRIAKGSDAVISIIEKLKASYPNRISLQLVENMPYNQALKVYAKADLVIDQLRVGWYGAFAVEVMKMGIPVIAYINKDDLHYLERDLAKDTLEAVINANEYDLYNILSGIMEEPEILYHRRDAVLDFVNKWHDPLKVGAVIKALYER